MFIFRRKNDGDTEKRLEKIPVVENVTEKRERRSKMSPPPPDYFFQII
jgi:hypothetical protein